MQDAQRSRLFVRIPLILTSHLLRTTFCSLWIKPTTPMLEINVVPRIVRTFAARQPLFARPRDRLVPAADFTQRSQPISTMKTVLKAEATSLGGRSGSISSPDEVLDVQLGNPLDPSADQEGPNPELFFAAAYSACYHGALINAAKKAGYAIENSKVHALVSLNEMDDGGYVLGVVLRAHIPDMERNEIQKIMEAAHQTCPYSRALRGDAQVRLEVEDDAVSLDQPAVTARK